MVKAYERRHSRWYEQLLFNRFFQALIGLPVVTLIPAFERWGVAFWQDFDAVRFNTLVSIGVAFVCVCVILRIFIKFPGVRGISFICPVVTIAFLIVVPFLFFTREDYSRQTMLGGYLLTLLWFF